MELLDDKCVCCGQVTDTFMVCPICGTEYIGRETSYRELAQQEDGFALSCENKECRAQFELIDRADGYLHEMKWKLKNGSVADLADAPVSNSGDEGREGSTPSAPTNE